MKRKKQTKEDEGEGKTNGLVPKRGQLTHVMDSNAEDVEMEDSSERMPSKKRKFQSGSSTKENGFASSARESDEEQNRATGSPASSFATAPVKLSRELARLQWESEGVKVSKARTHRMSPVEKGRLQNNEDIRSRETESADAMSQAGRPVDSVIGTPRKRGPEHLMSASKTKASLATPTKLSQGKTLFSTPIKANGAHKSNGTPKIQRNADRSARRKTTKTLIERTVLGITSDNDEDEENILQHIYDSDAEDQVDGNDIPGDISEAVSAPTTPSRRIGRPKGSKNREPSPLPSNLPPHELYFAQNRGKTQTSNNNLSSLALLDHEEYFSLNRKLEDPHKADIEFLEDTHAGSFNQWQFELSQDFNICIFGWGSKRSLLMKFAQHLYNAQDDHTRNKIVIVNGYVPNLTIRDILNTVASAISERGQKLGSQPAEMLENLTALLDQDKSYHITLMINSIDRGALRRPVTQTILSLLSSHPQISLIASADHPSFPLLWDTSLRSTYNFLFHDCTTFRPHAVEVDVVNEVHELLGRSGRRVGGKEGMSFVLKSLPENAKNLFRVLIGEQLIAMEEDSGNYDNEDDDNERLPGNMGRSEPGVEYRVLYQKAVEEFICSNEMNFRTLLKE